MDRRNEVSLLRDAAEDVSPVKLKDGREFEPYNYFENLKSKARVTERQDLVRQLHVVNAEYERAVKYGQKTLANNMLFSWRVLLSEISLLNLGFTQYIYKDDIKNLADAVQPKNAIKFCDWEDFPRIVPGSVGQNYLRAKEAGVFDGFIVVYSDLTGEDPRSKATQQQVARNKDPVLFGYFEEAFTVPGRYSQKDTVVERFSRMYVIASWEDEHCHLTYGKMLELLGAKSEHYELTESSLKSKYEKISEEQSQNRSPIDPDLLNRNPWETEEKQAKPWWVKLVKWFSGKPG